MSLSDDLAAQSALLAGVPEEARRVILRRLFEATDGLVTYWSETPTGRAFEPNPALRHTGHAPFQPDDLFCQPTLNLRRLMGIEARLTVEAAEAFILGQDHVAAWIALRDQCARLGQLYAELKRRTWVGLALLLLDWELRILRYRSSSVVASLLWGEAVVPAGAFGAGD
ncbi:MAG TPA: hypothetical protein VFU69_19485 [Ktedonobacterales bacterium]|nr:hypothetical protein [Ktedonobacterales bacterium]